MRPLTSGASSTHVRLASTLLAALATATLLTVRASNAGDPPPAPPRYKLTDLGQIDGRIFQPADINEAGRIVGGLDSERAARWTPTTANGATGTLVAFDVPGNSWSRLAALNEDGKGVGTASQGGNFPVAFTHTGNTATPLPGERAYALDINTAGMVVGGAYIGGFENGVVWVNGVLDALEVRGPGLHAAAHSVNDDGVIVGSAQLTVGFSSVGHAARWVNGDLEDLHAFPGNPAPDARNGSTAVGINNLDHIIGRVGDNTTGRQHGCLWHEGAVTDLGTLGGPDTIPEDINDSDQIVGSTGSVPAQAFRAFLYEAGEMVDLNTLIPPQSGYELKRAWAINDAGQIVCEAFFSGSGALRGVLLTPITLLQADLTSTLTAAPNPVLVGANLTYTGKVKNNGPSGASGVTADFALPAGVDLVSTNPDATRAGDTLTFTISELTSGATANLQVVVRPTAAAVLSASLEASALETDLTPADNRAMLDVTARTAAVDLELTATDAPDPALVGGSITYRTTVRNNGPDGATGVIITQPLSALTEFVSVETTRGTARSAGQTVIAEVGALGNGQSVVVTIIARALFAGTAASAPSVTGEEADGTPGNNGATATTAINARVADLSVTGTATPEPIDVGGVLTYRITVKNNGPDPATGARLVVPAAGLVRFQTVETTRGTALHNGTNVVAELGTLANNETALVTVTMLAETAGSFSSGAIGVAAETDTNPNDNVANLETTIRNPARPDLRGSWPLLRVKRQGQGAKIKYTITAAFKIANSGNAQSGASRVRFFLSTDTVRDAGDIPVTVVVRGTPIPVEIPINALAPAGSQRMAVPHIKVAKKTYVQKLKGKYLIGVADFRGSVLESDESNNEFAPARKL